MNRRILPCALLLLLAPAPPAPAALITGQVSGSVTRNLSTIFGAFPPPHAFAVGEPVALTFSYDDEVTGFYAPVEFSLTTGGGFAWESGPTPVLSALVTDDGTRFRWLLEGHARGFLDLLLDGGTGRLWYYRDMGLGDEGFYAAVTRDDEAPVAHTPEPPGIAMGLVGMALAGLYGWRRRR